MCFLFVGATLNILKKIQLEDWFCIPFQVLQSPITILLLFISPPHITVVKKTTEKTVCY